jgi:N-formylmaleamate deformylase
LRASPIKPLIHIEEEAMTEWSSGDVVANGIKIHFYRTGGDGPPVVLSHGFSDNGLCWIRAAKVLEKDYDVIMPDARGHGLSDAPAEGYSGNDMAADLAGLILALELDKPALMGHSMGAATTALAAILYPDRVGRIVLEDPPWFEADSPWAHGRLNLSEKERHEQAEQRRAEIVERASKTREELIALCREQSPTWDEIECGPWAESKLQLSPNVVQRVASERRHWSEIVPQIVCPTLLVIGDPAKKSIVTPELAQKAHEMNPLIQVAQIEGAGHSIRREQFGPYMEAVTAFLSNR